MLRGSGIKRGFRAVTAAGLLAILLVLALPCSSQALTLGDHDRQAWLEEETFWQKLWRQVGSLWSKVSVLIDPDGGDDDDPNDPNDLEDPFGPDDPVE